MLLTCGINHKTAPLKVRELLAFDQESASHALQGLLQHPAVNEAVLLSTCNRTEIYTEANSAEPFLSWLNQKQPGLDLKPY
ncbi:MAG: glutamyl-tRNA reductase, partial [Gammaproteobacteria bacterium]|nr:glutamyl-tRNA reductase [Gammaproteobacteria bacterium]